MRDVGEGAVTIVVIEDVLAALQAGWTTCHLNAFVGAAGCLWKRCSLDVEVDVVGDKEVEVAIAVIVKKGAAGVPPRLRLKQARLFRNVSEGAIAVVAVEDVLAVVADKEIVPAVIVVVANTATLAPSCRASPALTVTSVKVPSRLFLKR